MPLELHNGAFTLSDDPARLDVNMIFAFLSQTYWAKSRTRSLVEESIRNSFCVGVYRGSEQVGFARAITDRATFAYLADVFVLEPFRRRGLGRWMVERLINHPELKGLRRWCLVTQDAHELYRPVGFRAPDHPERYMELLQPYLELERAEAGSIVHQPTSSAGMESALPGGAAPARQEKL